MINTQSQISSNSRLLHNKVRSSPHFTIRNIISVLPRSRIIRTKIRSTSTHIILIHTQLINLQYISIRRMANQIVSRTSCRNKIAATTQTFPIRSLILTPSTTLLQRRIINKTSRSLSISTQRKRNPNLMVHIRNTDLTLSNIINLPSLNQRTDGSKQIHKLLTIKLKQSIRPRKEIHSRLSSHNTQRINSTNLIRQVHNLERVS